MLRNLLKYYFLYTYIFIFIILILICRRAKQLNASCSFQSGLLVCELTGDAVEVVLKVKMRWGKHTLIEDQYNRKRSSAHGRELVGEPKYLPEGRECPDVHRTQTQMKMALRVTL